MKRTLLAALSFTFLLTAALPSLAEAKAKQKIEWLHNYDKAVELSKSEHKPILIFFTGSDWCGWCKKLKKEVFDKPEFAESMGDKFVYLEIDQPMKGQSSDLEEQKDKLQKQYGIRGLPAVVIVDSNGRQIAQTGYKEGGPEAYAKHLQQLANR
ncbi:MAG: thioredoxin family protein [Parachlamydiales bacterium]